MRSRNSGSSKPTAQANKMTPGKKNASRAKTAPTTSSEQESPASPASPTTATPKSSDLKSGPITRGKQIKSMESVSAAIRSDKVPPEATPSGNFRLKMTSPKLSSVFLLLFKLFNKCNSILLVLLPRSIFFLCTQFDL